MRQWALAAIAAVALPVASASAGPTSYVGDFCDNDGVVAEDVTYGYGYGYRPYGYGGYYRPYYRGYYGGYGGYYRPYYRGYYGGYGYRRPYYGGYGYGYRRY